ncbi:isoaspartyl peptidase/L-asparaginase [Hyphobacterium sp. HN65]|uniref:Isoaspartyl peptidase/L-asparaginase n=1 Tax=Hyphobacterium lacteum TaxID=3116575 RepID=A0ABU7LRP2_9PROT|nr:isoaspartyl peptidase/L-asparaginase [Hyphobacterium sp. HN65]MEE2526567.1 isoaspartyl peptidase/L-asparaginase [Hyphobacterium sp. HN65]
MTSQRFALVLHGGAGVLAERSYQKEVDHMRALAERSRDMLGDGMAALDVVEAIVYELEISGLYVAGKGSSPNTDNRYELDAAIMDGETRNAGAVAAMEGFVSPIHAARKVMETTPHVMLAGWGANKLAEKAGLERVEDPDSYYTPAAVPDNRPYATGTVGCVALDRDGRLAAATSTGGTLKKTPGRVGDCPLIGAGTWADQEVALSCTGQGEFFIRSLAAGTAAARVRYLHESPEEACRWALKDVKRLGGDGGIIAVGRDGRVAFPYNSQGMKCAVLHADGRITSGVQEQS